MEVLKYLVVFSAISSVCFCRGVSYYELETLGVSCKPHDTCNTTSEIQSASRRNCECDMQCAHFGDCCLDAENPSPSSSVAPAELVCLRILPNAGYFTIGKCRRGWRNDETKTKCESEPNTNDPFSYVPVTTSGTTFTYKNRYCAICNDVQGNLLYWKLGVECPRLNGSIENYVHNNLTYNRNKSSWGVYISQEFYECFLQPKAPDQKRYLRFCYPNLISKCSPRWTEGFIQEKCESYTAYVHIRERDVTYRNVHCALCNNVRPTRLSCDSTFSRDFERTSFTTLFDINLEKGNAIGSGGTAPKCKQGEVYDPGFKRCQELSCGLPFLELRNGKCVPK